MIRVKVDNVEQDDPTELTGTGWSYSVNEEIPSKGLVVIVELKSEVAGQVSLQVAEVNGKSFTNTYEKYLVDSLVRFSEIDEGSTSTTFTFSVDHYDDAYSIDAFKLFAYSGSKCDTGANKEFKDL
jgi:hypothetical protein